MNTTFLKDTRFVIALGFITVAVLIRSILAVAVPYGPNAEEDIVRPTASPTPGTQTLQPGPPQAPAFKEQSFRGTGVRLTPKFQVESGLTVFRVTRKGEGAFSIQLKTGAGEDRELIVSQNGQIDASKALGLPAGEYFLSVAGSGEWTVNVEQPKPVAPAGVPRELKGRGSQATEFFSLAEGRATFKLTHQGEASFGPILLDQQGTPVDVLANETASFTGSKVVQIKAAGVYLLDVTADGDWTISVSQ